MLYMLACTVITISKVSALLLDSCLLATVSPCRFGRLLWALFPSLRLLLVLVFSHQASFVSTMSITSFDVLHATSLRATISIDHHHQYHHTAKAKWHVRSLSLDSPFYIFASYLIFNHRPKLTFMFYHGIVCVM
jgi:hypothetical protein